jgi:hypothetical protein
MEDKPGHRASWKNPKINYGKKARTGRGKTRSIKKFVL